MTEQDEAVLFGGDSFSPQNSGSRAKNILVDPRQPINPLDHSSDPLVNKLRTLRENLKSAPAIWSEMSKLCPDKLAIVDDHLCDEKISATFQQMDEIVRKGASIFSSLNIGKGDNVAILAENSARWLMADHGIQLVGGASAVRGADAPPDELRYIYEHSDSKGVVVLQGPKLLKKLYEDARKNQMPGLGLSNEKHGEVKTVILLNAEKQTSEKIQEFASVIPGVKVHLLSDLLNDAAPISDENVPSLNREDLMTIVYTSGTTGRPKGVMLTHGNILHQMGHRLSQKKAYEETEPLPGETMLSLLPVWHITERTFELWMFTRGCNVVYSSIRTFKNDLAKFKPQWMVLVPRVLEKVATGIQNKFASGSAVAKALVKLFTSTGMAKNKYSQIANGLIDSENPPSLIDKIKAFIILRALAPVNALGNKLVWSKVQEGFGGRQKVIISGGSALAGGLESFYQTAGIDIVVGYGLTECSPLISHRRIDSNLIVGGCVGLACRDTEMRVVDPEANPDAVGERQSLPDGEPGVVMARGPQVMRGYYKNEEATNKAIDSFGWFDTGDLGRMNPVTGDLILTGRIKDTIVLSNGENVEPNPIEDAILSESTLIEQVMLTGQDGRRITAIAVLSPEELSNLGYLGKEKAAELQKMNEMVNDPKCTPEDSSYGCDVLSSASVELRSNGDLVNALQKELKKATSGGKFRPWEQVSDVYFTLEPFAMSNGLLTQSYKVKRDFVMKRYENELPE